MLREKQQVIRFLLQVDSFNATLIARTGCKVASPIAQAYYIFNVDGDYDVDDEIGLGA